MVESEFTLQKTAEKAGKESELYRDHSSHVKRRRMLQFESEVLETPLCNDEEFLRSKVVANYWFSSTIFYNIATKSAFFLVLGDTSVS